MYPTKEFINSSKYTKWYFSIIENAKVSNRKRKEGVFELHHILPKSIYPEYTKINQNKWNGVLLTPKEHFVCHLLLSKMFISKDHSIKMEHAITTFMKGSNLHSRHYDLCSKLRVKLMTGENNPNFGKGTMLGKHHSEEAKRKIGEANKGRIKSLDGRKRISESKLGKKRPAEVGNAISQSLTGSKYYNDGKENRRFHPDKVPSGFVLGFLKKTASI